MNRGIACQIRRAHREGKAPREIRGLWVKAFRNVEELRLALHDWLKTYNEQWLIERYGHRSPAAVRREWLARREAT
jgi:hypothetical protein